MHPLTCRTSTFLLALALLPVLISSCATSAEPPDCISIGTKHPEDLYIRKPGHYCLTENLHARPQFADHWAEGTMIRILSSDVILDLQGHYLTHNNQGVGVGILINDATNIHIRNGVLQDFKTAILRGPKYPLSSNKEEPPVYDAQTNTYRFPISQIVVENVTFKNNKTNIVVRLKKDSTP